MYMIERTINGKQMDDIVIYGDLDGAIDTCKGIIQKTEGWVELKIFNEYNILLQTLTK